MTTKTEKLYGCYSKIAEQLHGSCVYLDSNGKQATVTDVNSTNDFSKYGFKDKICIGEVTKFVSSNMKVADKNIGYEKYEKLKFT